MEQEKSNSKTEIRVRWHPTDTDETFDGTVIDETDRIYVVVPDNSHSPTQNWDKRRCEIIIMEPQAEEKIICRIVGPLDLSLFPVLLQAISDHYEDRDDFLSIRVRNHKQGGHEIFAILKP